MNVDNNVLYRLTKTSYGEMTRQIVMPNSYKHHALKIEHSMLTAGYVGVQVTLTRCQKFSHWIGMKKDVENYCKACLVCNSFKRLGYAPAPLRSYPDVDMPFERVYMDLIGPIGNSEKKYKYCLVLIDVLTRYLIAEPIKTKTAIEVAKVFF